MPTRPLTVPTDAEFGLIFAAKYETDIRVDAAQAQRRFHAVGALTAVAVAVFGYDAVSVILQR
jgi:hypothetical protein